MIFEQKKKRLEVWVFMFILPVSAERVSGACARPPN